MKLLTLPLLLCAMIALSRAATTPEPKSEPEKEDPTAEDAEEEEEVEEETEEEGTEEPETDEEEDAGNSTKEEKHVVKRAASCPGGWTPYGSRCFRYYGVAKTWAEAERLCQSQGGNLASVHSKNEDSWIQSYVYSKNRRSNAWYWIGGSDGEQDTFWLWSDGSQYKYSSWCGGRPRSSNSLNCMRILYKQCGKKCWNAITCHYRYPFVCARKI